MADPRALLRTERDRAVAQIASLTSDLSGIIDATAGANTDDEHDPEGSTIAFERAQVLALIGQARDRLQQVDRALARLDAGTYGTCQRCSQPIAPARLAARPAAAYCVQCATG